MWAVPVQLTLVNLVYVRMCVCVLAVHEVSQLIIIHRSRLRSLGIGGFWSPAGWLMVSGYHRLNQQVINFYLIRKSPRYLFILRSVKSCNQTNSHHHKTHPDSPESSIKMSDLSSESTKRTAFYWSSVNMDLSCVSALCITADFCELFLSLTLWCIMTTLYIYIYIYS